MRTRPWAVSSWPTSTTDPASPHCHSSHRDLPASCPWPLPLSLAFHACLAPPAWVVLWPPRQTPTWRQDESRGEAVRDVPSGEGNVRWRGNYWGRPWSRSGRACGGRGPASSARRGGLQGVPTPRGHGRAGKAGRRSVRFCWLGKRIRGNPSCGGRALEGGGKWGSPESRARRSWSLLLFLPGVARTGDRSGALPGGPQNELCGGRRHRSLGGQPTEGQGSGLVAR